MMDQIYAHLCLPHTGLRQSLPQPLPTHGTGSAKRWQVQTPAMAAGLTDHVWTLGGCYGIGRHRGHNQRRGESQPWWWEVAREGDLQRRWLTICELEGNPSGSITR